MIVPLLDFYLKNLFKAKELVISFFGRWSNFSHIRQLYCNVYRYLRSEMDSPQFSQRFGILLESYLKGCGKNMFVSNV